jgi:hypothetical protein
MTRRMKISLIQRKMKRKRRTKSSVQIKTITGFILGFIGLKKKPHRLNDRKEDENLQLDFKKRPIKRERKGEGRKRKLSSPRVAAAKSSSQCHMRSRPVRHSHG